MRVLLVGGGVAGLTAAVALRQAGIEAVVLERSSEPMLIGSGLYMWSNAFLALRRVGAEDAVRANAVEIERNVFMTAKGRVLADWPVGEVSKRVGAPTMGALRGDVLKALLEAGGDEVTRYGTTCTGFEQDDHAVTANLQDHAPERADVLVGGDGVDSTIRAQLLGAAPPRYWGYIAWRGVLDWDDEPIGHFRLYADPGCRFLSHPVAPGKLYWFASVRAPRGGKDDPSTLKDVLAERYAGFADRVRAVIDATPVEAIVRSDVVDRDPVDRWGEGRVTLMGDAAHPMTPHLAQGAGTSLEDGVVLARHLSADGTPPAALRAYEGERMKRTAAFTKQARVMGRTGHWENPAACLIRDALLTVTLRTVGLKQTERSIEFAG